MGPRCTCVCLFNTHKRGEIEPADYSNKRRWKEIPPERKEGRKNFNAPARSISCPGRIVSLDVNKHTHTLSKWLESRVFSYGWKPLLSFLFSPSFVGISFFLWFVYKSQIEQNKKKKGQDCCCFHLKSARSFFSHLISSAFFYCKAVFILMARIEKWRREEQKKKNKGEKRMTPLIIYDQTFFFFLCLCGCLKRSRLNKNNKKSTWPRFCVLFRYERDTRKKKKEDIQ